MGMILVQVLPPFFVSNRWTCIYSRLVYFAYLCCIGIRCHHLFVQLCYVVCSIYLHIIEKEILHLLIWEQQMADALDAVDWEGRFYVTRILFSLQFFAAVDNWEMKLNPTSNIVPPCFDICHSNINSIFFVIF